MPWRLIFWGVCIIRPGVRRAICPSSLQWISYRSRTSSRVQCRASGPSRSRVILTLLQSDSERNKRGRPAGRHLNRHTSILVKTVRIARSVPALSLYAWRECQVSRG
ncbi:hypothetical protein F5Y17DRAFT_435063 [Xylariaceae sp. FL0594]|nr:hypothetical protein F5Y17DRAFT_435063 [Xylariaceae sp. FL0594]